MDLNNFVRTQTVLNNIADILEKLYISDPIIQNEEAFNELTERTYNMLLETDENIEIMVNDQEILDSLAAIDEEENPLETVKDMAHIMIHSTMAKQSIIIDQLLMKINELEN